MKNNEIKIGDAVLVKMTVIGIDLDEDGEPVYRVRNCTDAEDKMEKLELDNYKLKRVSNKLMTENTELKEELNNLYERIKKCLD